MWKLAGTRFCQVDLDEPLLELLLREYLRGGGEAGGSAKSAGRGKLPPNKLGFKLFLRQVQQAKSRHSSVSGPQLGGMAREGGCARGSGADLGTR